MELTFQKRRNCNNFSNYDSNNFDLLNLDKKKHLCKQQKRSARINKNLTPNKKSQKNISIKSKTPKKTQKSLTVTNYCTNICSPKQFKPENEQQFSLQKQKCLQCQKSSELLSQLSKKLSQSSQSFKKLQENYNNLKEQYQKKVKKYKTKSKILNDQIKLFKWILGERKDFEEIIEQIQKARNNMGSYEMKQIEKVNKKIMNQDRKGQNQSNLSQMYDNQQNVQKGFKNQEFLDNKTKELRQISSQRQQILSLKINFLQQKVLQLQMKNTLLQGIKRKDYFKQSKFDIVYQQQQTVKHVKESNLIDLSKVQNSNCCQWSYNFESNTKRSGAERSNIYKNGQNHQIFDFQRRRQPLSDKKSNDIQEFQRENVVKSRYIDSIKQRQKLLGL